MTKLNKLTCGEWSRRERKLNSIGTGLTILNGDLPGSESVTFPELRMLLQLELVDLKRLHTLIGLNSDSAEKEILSNPLEPPLLTTDSPPPKMTPATSKGMAQQALKT